MNITLSAPFQAFSAPFTAFSKENPPAPTRLGRLLVLSVGLLGLCSLSAFGQTIRPEHLKGLELRNIGPGAMSGRITAIAVDPVRPEVIYAGAASGGLWRSRSSGTRWEPIFDKAPNQSVGSIAIHPNNPDDIWVGTGEGNPRNSQNFGAGIFHSIDGGKNWTCMGLQGSRSIHRVFVHRDDPNTIWAAVLGSAYGPTEERGVFKSSDGGKTWRKTLYINDLTGCADLVVDPQNPNKLIAAMWEYRRWPWFFKSGGKGSGLHISYDGGETWERRNSNDGLPEGELGRMGVAIAASNPDVVYALVEAKENALYKSTDGGQKWRKMADKNQGDRPFYYHELYVDPKDENRVYSVHSQITKSEDGGKSFEGWVGYWRIHPDHHAFWISPNDSKYIIDGNDGGLNITYDGGKTWRYAENIPVGQFYHVETDNEWPYNVYGGLQDNGSWVGPSAVWKSGGIRNSDWQEVYFGDGFETMPRKDDPRYVYAMSQGGELGLVDRKTGQTKYIKPLHPDGKTDLRWNWNAALAQDPFRPQAIYFGSQFLHHSRDLGQSWDLISPDLTTADTSKLHQGTSGGLTFDATNAENHCTIVSIAPSPLADGLVWVGTDDGNVQLTRDGGKTWENVGTKLPQAPKNAWIPAIEASPHDAATAYVVLNNYRQNDWNPYLYVTKDYGKSWKRLANPKNVNSFCLSVVQDPTAANLLFLGTDQGLCISVDGGDSWMPYQDPKGGALPAVPVYDLKIQARDGDLVIGTFGRGIWIMDNLSILRDRAQMRKNTPEAAFKLFPAQTGILANYRSYDGPRFAGDATYEGENKGTALRIPVWVKPLPDTAKAKDAKKKDKATIIVISASGDTLRRFKSELDTAYSSIWWYMDTKGVRYPSKNEPDKEQLEPGGGPSAPPGDYWVKVRYRDQKDSVLVTVMEDPRLNVSAKDRKAQGDAIREFYKTVEKAAKAYDRLKEAEKTIKLVEDQWQNVPDSLKKEALKTGTSIKDSIGVLKELFFQHKEVKGIQRDPDNLNASLYRAYTYLEAQTAAAQTAFTAAKNQTESLVARVNSLLDAPWKKYREQVEGVKYSLFKDWDRL
jgi:photosystem II stability/assembly factor-like uncharacterized protein